MYGKAAGIGAGAGGAAAIQTLPETGGSPLAALGLVTDPTSIYFWIALFALVCVVGAIWRILPRRER
ncbi:MAG: hypothetical protein K6T51_12985 [Rubrobacteraceae bacterium]|uniref:hypothetical protein n=1 Tax=Rubrobacter naiadicus TaxID=1392641 RepID=UPI00236094BE|nr:hypothetical protein [Rubrobacter naiadicus]MBX6763260.1 hypothetical protein [Rubrobacteraceae bacterium]MCL6439516.1 hypothetical protein [Rubrobacteraceae bacterium]